MAQVARQILLTLGIEPATPVDDPERHAELYRVARRVRDTGRRTIGLVPVNQQSGVAVAAIQLGLVLGDAAITTVAFVDANPAGPVLASLAASAIETIEDFALVTLGPRLVALTPRTEAKRPRRASLEPALVEAARRYEHVLVDLTGFEATGEHAWAFDLVDGVALVARGGATREHEIIAKHHEIPPERDLGVLIVG